MSLQITDAIACPRCGDVNPTTIWTSINADINPDLKQELLDGTFFSHDCSRCHYRFEVAQPLLYHDMRRTTLVHLVFPGEAPPSLTGVRMLLSQSPGLNYKLRLVGTVSDLVEKIAILDDSLDDRLVEAFKFALAEKLKSRGLEVRSLRYLRKAPSAASKALFLVEEPDGTQEITVPFRKAYDDLRSALREAITKESQSLQWRLVDSQYLPGLLAAGVVAG